MGAGRTFSRRWTIRLTLRLQNAITPNGGGRSICSWLKGRWSLSCQIVPKRLLELLGDLDSGRARRAMEAMLKMKKVDIAEIERAANAA